MRARAKNADFSLFASLILLVHWIGITVVRGLIFIYVALVKSEGLKIVCASVYGSLKALLN